MGSNKVPGLSVEQVSEVVSKEPTLLEKAVAFNNALGFEKRLPITSMYKLNVIESKEFLNELLCYWILNDRANASTERLMETLKALEFTDSIVSLQPFEDDRLVVTLSKNQPNAHVEPPTEGGSNFHSQVNIPSDENENSTPRLTKFDREILTNKQKEIAEIMVKDSNLVARWKGLCVDLGIPDEEIVRYKRQLKLERINAEGLFEAILKAWVIKFPQSVLEDLCKVLREHRSKFVAEMLETEFAQG